MGGLSPANLIAYGSQVLFDGNGPSEVSDLWASDGTGPGTSAVFDDISPEDPALYSSNTPNPTPPSATTADLIMHGTGGSNGLYEIYDLGNNTILSAASLALLGPEWKVAGLGGFFGSDTTDMMMRNSATGAFQIYDISNDNVTNAVAMGQVGLEWTVAGFGDFSSRSGETDMLMRNSNTSQFEIYDISNNAITSAAPMGQELVSNGKLPASAISRRAQTSPTC